MLALIAGVVSLVIATYFGVCVLGPESPPRCVVLAISQHPVGGSLRHTSVFD